MRLPPWRKIIPKIMSKRDIKYTVFTMQVLSRLESVQEVRGLDVGGNSGTQAECLRKMLNVHIIVLDVDKTELSRGKRRHSRMEYILGDAHCLPFRSDSIHLVYSYSLLEHLKSPKKAISEQIRVSKGPIITQIPNLHYFIEPHTKMPLLYLFPMACRKKILQTTKSSVNFDVTHKKLIEWFYELGANLTNDLKLYHVQLAKFFLRPQGYLMEFEKIRRRR